MEQAQESRTERVSIAVTKTEKSAIRAIAALRETDESNLCRSVPVAEIVAEYRRLQMVGMSDQSADPESDPAERGIWDRIHAEDAAKRRTG